MAANRGRQIINFKRNWGLFGQGIVDYLYDEMEFGERVAYFLDSENNTPDIHFLGWDPFPPFSGEFD